MKLAPSLLLAVAAVVSTAESAIPEPFPSTRYEAMLAQSPFALATPVAAPPAPAERGFASDWYVTGLGYFEEKDYVSIKSRDLSTSFSLYGTEPVNGVSLVGVEWSNERGKSAVTVKKGEDTARIEFNQAELQTTAPTPLPGAQPGLRPGQPQGGNRPVVTPIQNQLPVTSQPGIPGRVGIPRPTSGPVISQAPPLPGAPAAGQNSVTGEQLTGGDSRRRIRVINPPK